MTKLHELLAAERTVTAASTAVLDETLAKMQKENYFSGFVKSLQMLESTPANEALEAAAKETKALPTTVLATLDYAFDLYGNMENLQISKNKTNTQAKATVQLNGVDLFVDLPVDQLLGLEARLTKIRAIMLAVPTLDASIEWTYDANQGCWISPETFTTKTETKQVPVILAPATDKHPAQVKEASQVAVVGKVSLIKRSGAATAVQKSDAIMLVDNLLVEVKKARMRANDTEVINDNIGAKLKEVLLAPFQKIN
jgi:hypothetical protein